MRKKYMAVRIKSGFKKKMAILLAGMMTVTAIFGVGIVFGNNEKKAPRDLLGNLYSYAVVAEEARIAVDFESNIAVNSLAIDGTKDVGNSVRKFTNSAGVMYIGNITEGVLQLRSASYIVSAQDISSHLNMANYPSVKLVQMAEYMKIEQEFDELNKRLVKYNQRSEGARVNLLDINNAVIDVRSCDTDDGVCAVYVDYAAFSRVQEGGLHIYKNDDQILVINMTGNYNESTRKIEVPDSVTLSRAKITVGDTTEYTNNDSAFNMENSREIIWNFGNFDGHIYIKEFTGICVATEAKVEVWGTSRGHVLANSFGGYGGEWHCVMNDIEDETTTGETETDSTTEKEISSEPDSSSAPEADTKPENTTEPQSDIEDNTTEPESESESETETETEPESEQETETEPESESETETEPESEPETETEPESESETETEPESESETETEPESEPETETETEPESEPETETEPESEQETNSEPESSSQGETTSQPESDTSQGETTSQPESDTSQPESDTSQGETTSQPELDTSQDETTSQPESDTSQDETTSQPETTTSQDETTSQPETSSSEEDTSEGDTIPTEPTSEEPSSPSETETTSAEESTAPDITTTVPAETDSESDTMPEADTTTPEGEDPTTETRPEEDITIDDDTPLVVISTTSPEETPPPQEEPTTTPEEEEIIIEDFIPLAGGNPKTGDESNVFIYIIIAAVTVCGLTAVLILTNKKKD